MTIFDIYFLKLCPIILTTITMIMIINTYLDTVLVLYMHDFILYQNGP